MRKLSFAQATLEAMAEEMAKDEKIFVMGEDIARQGGVFGQFKGLAQQFPNRVLDTPISETFITGGGVGAALAGARPVVDMHFIQPDGKNALYVWRAGQYAADTARAGRLGKRWRGTAFAGCGILVRTYPRCTGYCPFQSL